MSIRLSTRSIISREVLREVGDARLAEAEVLLRAGRYAGSIYLAGYAVECYLKVAVCVTLRWDALLETFKVHDLEGLLLHSGFDGDLRATDAVHDNFVKITAIWKFEGHDSIRYRRPREFDKPSATAFLHYVCDPTTGVVPWLRRAIS